MLSVEARSWVLSLANFYGGAVCIELVIGGGAAFHQKEELSSGGFRRRIWRSELLTSDGGEVTLAKE